MFLLHELLSRKILKIGTVIFMAKSTILISNYFEFLDIINGTCVSEHLIEGKQNRRTHIRTHVCLYTQKKPDDETVAIFKEIFFFNILFCNPDNMHNTR